jgi:23S rRNA (cytidine1920-2'-O)/16S rRNA (cytidine1409-2'-O)-methyltransferase
MAGLVFEGERRLDKPGRPMAADAGIEVRGAAHPWVGRGGLKLDHALDAFAIEPAGAIALDIGASTGGFTDVLLARGAARVHAVDVGHGQLAWKLRNDPRVVVLERTNARHLTREQVPGAPSLIVADVSFISLTLALPAALALAAPGARLVALVKPQFEVGRGEVGKGGIVRDPALHEAACQRVRAFLESAGWTVEGLIESPVTGADGNREFLIAARRR